MREVSDWSLNELVVVVIVVVRLRSLGRSNIKVPKSLCSVHKALSFSILRVLQHCTVIITPTKCNVFLQCTKGAHK